MAEGLFRKAAAHHTAWNVSSAGIAANVGAQASSNTKKVLENRSADLKQFRSRQVSEKMLEKADVVCAMTESHLIDLHDEFPQYADKYYLVCDFIEGELHGSSVPDPIGMGMPAYEAVAEIIEEAIPNLILFLES